MLLHTMVEGSPLEMESPMSLESQECPCPVTGFLGFSIWQEVCACEDLHGLSISGILHIDTMLPNSALTKVKF